jgi:hypothetical protein
MEHKASSEESLRKLILAKANLAKKLIEYSEDILEEIEWLNK